MLVETDIMKKRCGKVSEKAYRQAGSNWLKTALQVSSPSIFTHQTLGFFHSFEGLGPTTRVSFQLLLTGCLWLRRKVRIHPKGSLNSMV